jgi:hypothetical protein
MAVAHPGVLLKGIEQIADIFGFPGLLAVFLVSFFFLTPLLYLCGVVWAFILGSKRIVQGIRKTVQYVNNKLPE